jgi:hypothetical protein
MHLKLQPGQLNIQPAATTPGQHHADVLATSNSCSTYQGANFMNSAFEAGVQLHVTYRT